MYRGVGADFEKPKKYFRLIMKRVLKNVEKSGFQKNFEKKLTLYTNKKVQLQLDFLISPAVAGLFY